ncbi:MAG: LlaJI family restriction endonuclease [Clostridia bacterium]|nr:LlaJI family restriction endonuclease [Clostridia bacterium]
MDFISVYIREQKRYTKKELLTMFRFNDEEIEKFIRELKSYGILKAVKNDPKQKNLTELYDEDIEITDDTLANDELLYVFTFVGVITFGNRVLKCYPKYITAEEPYDEVKQVLKVLNKYSASEQMVKMFNGAENKGSFNLLSVILYLIQDYHENGVYSNSEDIVEINGEGNILWNQTISDGFAIINENRPYYVELFTQHSIDDEYDYFTRLHKTILTACSNQLDTAGLLGLFEYDALELSEETLEDFGETDYILYRIQSELNVQFNTRRQLLLKSIYAYIAQKRTLLDHSCVSLFGTTSFNLVWEKVCAAVFDNKLDVALGRLKLPVPLKDGYKKAIKLIDVIEKPKWSAKNHEGEVFAKEAQDTLIPDLIGLYTAGGKSKFIIFDAKYYCLQLEEDKPLRGQPGIESITKQYLYQLAYQEFIDDHQFDIVKNCFLLPTEEDVVINKGTASLGILSKMNLEPIQVRLLPARRLYDCYLSQKFFNIDYLELD